MDARFVWLAIALIACIATLSVTELVRVFAHRVRAVDTPGGRRLHHAPTARLGGLGIYWGFLIALLAGTQVPALRGLGEAPGVVGPLLAGTLLLVAGWFDDLRGMRPAVKLGCQALAGGVLWAAGWRAESAGLPGLFDVPLGALSLPVTVFWVVAVTNAMNLIDGLDGLAVGLGIVAIAGAALFGPAHGALGAALAGALLGFLWFNLHPAMIFMGDAGSLFVGVMVAALTMGAGGGHVTGAFPLIPALLVAVPAVDTLDAILRRAGGVPRSRAAWRALPRRISSADSLHIHHRFRRAGFSVRQTAGALWLGAIVCAGAALTFDLAPAAGWSAALGAAAMAVLVRRRLAERTAERGPLPVTVAEAAPLVAGAAAPGRERIPALALAGDDAGDAAEATRRAA